MDGRIEFGHNLNALQVRLYRLTSGRMSQHGTRLKITAKGQVTLRRPLLDHLGVQPGDRLVFEILPDGRVEVRAAEKGNIDAFFGCLAKPGRLPLSIDEMDGIVAAGWAGEP